MNQTQEDPNLHLQDIDLAVYEYFYLNCDSKILMLRRYERTKTENLRLQLFYTVMYASVLRNYK